VNRTYFTYFTTDPCPVSPMSVQATHMQGALLQKHVALVMLCCSVANVIATEDGPDDGFDLDVSLLQVSLQLEHDGPVFQQAPVHADALQKQQLSPELQRQRILIVLTISAGLILAGLLCSYIKKFGTCMKQDIHQMPACEGAQGSFAETVLTAKQTVLLESSELERQSPSQVFAKLSEPAHQNSSQVAKGEGHQQTPLMQPLAGQDSNKLQAESQMLLDCGNSKSQALEYLIDADCSDLIKGDMDMTGTVPARSGTADGEPEQEPEQEPNEYLCGDLIPLDHDGTSGAKICIMAPDLAQTCEMMLGKMVQDIER